ncbi:MAG: pentapeptide repeat-containing protein [Vampirovibrionales bacterium]|nr:pentapeptide repeat-containing protein [Vampirovibrionales bacterium]
MADQTALTMIQEERFLEFNNYVEKLAGAVDLTNAHLRGYDLRKCHLKKADLSGAYLRSCDLRSCDLSEATLDGASMKEAKVSGVLFPRGISAQEIQMSLVHGTRIRSGL